MSSPQTLESVTAKFLADGEPIKPYAIAMIINQQLRAAGVTKVDKDGQVVPLQIRPQMMYNYDRNGHIVKGRKSACRYSLDEVLAFVSKYLKKYGIDLDGTSQKVETDTFQMLPKTDVQQTATTLRNTYGEIRRVSQLDMLRQHFAEALTA